MSCNPRNAAIMRAGTVKKLFCGAAVLTFSAVLTKIMGLVYKIPLVKYVGVEGMAYFLAANHIYILLFVISTSGLPVAVAVLVSRYIALNDYAAVRKTYITAKRLFMALGLSGSAFMIAGAHIISDAVKIPQSYYCIIAIAPAVFLSCMSGAVRGYFQGHQIMKCTAFSQIIEASGKLVFGLLGALYAIRKSYAPEIVAAFAISGITIGVALSALYLFISKAVFDKKRKKECHFSVTSEKNFLPDLVKLALPITLSSSVISLSGLIDTVLIPNCLSVCGYDSSYANTLYSCYGNMAIPLFSLAPSLIAPVAMALVPLVTSSKHSDKTDDEKSAISFALRLTLFIAMPASVGIAAFANPILNMIFDTGSEAISAAAPMLMLLSLSTVPACLITVTNAVLQAQGHAARTIYSMTAGMTVKLISEYIILKNVHINIYGAPISTFLCDLFVMTINLYYVFRYSPKFNNVVKPAVYGAVASFVAVLLSVLLWRCTSIKQLGKMSVIIPVFLTFILYIAFSFLFGAVKDITDGIYLYSKNKDTKRDIKNGQTRKNLVFTGKRTL